ncbi:MAG: hypothetical protein KC505_10045 [Myxococcales bacterium]|nr:hypothetical protein [Myxococcales bacterium]USN49854.1 MAG: hypothetical protein H6731_06125 [Myxococcales bacterium]
MRQCSECSSFIVRENCSYCSLSFTPSKKSLKPKSSASINLAKAVGASALSVTLMACYGAPPEYLMKDEHRTCERDQDCMQDEKCIDNTCQLIKAE